MLLNIVSNPHTKEPKDLHRALVRQYKRLLPARVILDDKGDPNAMQKLKQIFNRVGKR